MRLLLATVLLLGLTACSTGNESESADSPRASTPSPTPPSPTRPRPTSPGPAPTQPDASSTAACAEVRAGIRAFNIGDFESTVAGFRRALPLAETQARTDASRAADDLVEAVTYYAELAPKDYPERARSSLEFAKYKAITLGQCLPVGEPSEDRSPEPPEVTT